MSRFYYPAFQFAPNFGSKMMKNLWPFCFGILIWSCQSPSSPSHPGPEKLIIETLENETLYFCERNLAMWQEQWSHQPFVSKMYTGNTPFREFIGWEAVNQNTVDHIRKFPDPIPVPDSNQEYAIELFGEAAMVFYSKNGESGTIREVRLMVLEDEKWKIASMQTIY